MGFEGNLAWAMVLNVALKFFTFALSTILTRHLTPAESGINFSCQLYLNTILFLARDCVRSVNARKNLRDRAGNGEAVLQVMNCAFASLPLGIILILLFELLPMCGIHLFPSLVAFLRVSGEPLSAAAAAAAAGAGGGVKEEVALGVVSLGFPELLLGMSVIILLSIEPCFALVQLFDYLRNIVASEFWALLARLLVCLLFVKARGGLGGDQYTARMCFATGTFSYAIATVVYFLWLWNRNYSHHQSDGDDGKEKNDLIQKARKGAVMARWGVVRPSLSVWQSWLLFLRTSLPWPLLSWRAVYAEVLREVSLMWQFFAASCLQLVLTEGERFALATCGSAAAMGHYDLVVNLGSLVTRILFRLWESACFVKWSRDAAKGHQAEAVALLFTMLRIALYFGAAVMLLGPLLAEVFLSVLFSRRWASPAAVRALQLYCFLLPLMGLYGLLDAFLRATASASVLKVVQRVMVAHAVLYVVACVLVLRLGWVADPVAGLIFVNCVCMAFRCASSVALLLLTWSAPRAPPLCDFWKHINVRIVVVWGFLFVCTRCTTQNIVAVMIAAPVYVAALATWDAGIRFMALSFFSQ